MEGVNGKDLIVKDHTGHNDSIRDFGHRTNCKLIDLSLCIIFLL